MRVAAVMECAKCGAWKDVPYAWARPAASYWHCYGCGRQYNGVSTADYVRVFALTAADARWYDRWLDFHAQDRETAARYGSARIDVRPVLEPLLWD